MRQRFFIREVICIAFHRKTKTFCQNIISGCRSFLSSFYIQLICFITYSLSKIRISFNPHVGFANLLYRINFIPPDRHMRINIFTLKNVHQFHFDCIATSVTDSTLGADCNYEIVVILRRTLFESTYNVFSYIT